TDPAVRMNASLVPALPERGRVGFFCQSGALGSSILERLRARGLGVSTFVSAGNRADVSGNDLLQYWQDDEDTDLVLMYLESLGNARKFARLVRRIAPTKPVLMVGSPGAAVPSGHLARTSGLGEQAVAGLLAACGQITLDRVDQMLDLAAVLSCQPMPGSRSVAIVGNSDALGVLAMNAVARHGGSVSGQPVTFPRDATVARYRQQVQQALDRGDVGVVLAIHVPPVEGIDDADLLPQLAAVGAAAAKPVVAVMQGTGPTTSIRSGVPVFVDVEDAISALAFLLSLARWRLEGADEPVPAEGADPERLAEIVQEAVLADRLVLQGPQVSQVLAALGVQVSIGLPAPAASVRLRLVTDELFGPVVWASLDDPAAICLGDVAVRLAPMHPAQARQAIASLQALDTAMVGPEFSDGHHLDGIADLMHRLSWLPVWVPGVVGLELTGLHWGIDGPRAAAATAHLDAEPEPMEPQARRMGAG
ncbi:MAG: acetate--CoA ligase family protein, partial [Actinomycetales bacterium]